MAESFNITRPQGQQTTVTVKTGNQDSNVGQPTATSPLYGQRLPIVTMASRHTGKK
jgi:hypothetical protein